MKNYFFLSATFLFFFACNSEKTETPEETEAKTSFVQLDKSQTNIHFTNSVVENEKQNYFNYAYIYTGAGCAAGDVNNDGLTDLYFTSNERGNKLYLNKGNFQFEDVTDKAGVAGTGKWTTGTVMIDVNSDGLLDIYVCKSGLTSAEERRNLLYINNGDLSFTEKAADFGLNNNGYSTSISQLDYDKDGDLDIYLVNHRVDFKNNSKIIPNLKLPDGEFATDRLFRNNGDNTFTDVTDEAGIRNLAWGLSSSVGDFNGDGWEDIYVANDFLEPDFLYLNNQDGTFTESIKKVMKHISFYGMGSDYADINNDGLNELYVLDMAPGDHVRSKRNMASMSTDNFWNMVKYGYHKQYMLNTLQLNQSNGIYSDIGQMAGVSKTDWSWAALFADYDNDGWKDLFVTNGIKRDVTDNDFNIKVRQMIAERGQNLPFDEVMGILPSEKLKNFMFKNNGDLTFSKVAADWGIDEKTVSHGCVYADFDQDGDLDLVINNLDSPASVYENKSEGNNYLRVKLEGSEKNKQGIGARIELSNGSSTQYQDLYTCRGYLSSVEPIAHFGLGKADKLDVKVIWPDGKVSEVKGAEVNKTIAVSYAESKPAKAEQEDETQLFALVENSGVDFEHQENEFNDFATEILLPHKQSEHGPFISSADVNADGLQDFFIGGAKGQAGALYLQVAEGSFKKSSSQPWTSNRKSEDLGSLFFDADGDEDLDLYVSSGGTEFQTDDRLLQDRLYINDGKGNFTKSGDALPEMLSSTNRVAASDFDQDGDMDLVVGGRNVPGKYPFAPRTYLLQNDGGKFTDVTADKAPELQYAGMITGLAFSDYDGDGDEDLLAVGEWMPFSVYENDGGKFSNQTKDLKLENTTGWWTSLTPADIDGDGDTDYIAGNIGENNKFHPKEEKPLSVYAADFDGSGTIDIVLSKYQGDICYPVRGRECSSQQMPFITDKFPTYEGFATAELDEIYTKEELDAALHYEVKTFSSTIFINNGDGSFGQKHLPNQAQIAPINGIIVRDINEDGNQDLIIAGNYWGAEVETVAYDAGVGTCLINDGQANFEPMYYKQTGFLADGNVKDLKMIGDYILVANNNDAVQVYSLNKKSNTKMALR